MAEGVEPDTPELYIFARFHARPGLETEVAEALRDHGPNARIAVVPKGPYVMPVVAG